MKRLLLPLLVLFLPVSARAQTTSSIANFPFNFQTPSTSTAQVLIWDPAANGAGLGAVRLSTIGTNLTYTGSTTNTLSASGGGGGSGTVTSVGLSLPSVFTVSNSPVTSSGTLTAVFPSVANHAFLGNNTGSSTTSPTFVQPAFSDLSIAAQAAHTFLGNSSGSSAVPSFAQPADTDLSLSTTDTTTNATNVHHGFVPKTPADANKFLNGGSAAAFTTIDYSQLTGTPTAPTTPRVTSITGASTSTWSPNADTTDIFEVTGQTTNVSTINNPSGTPVNGQKLIMRVTGTAARTLTWSGSQWRGSTDIPLPTTTTTTKTLYMGFIYNTATPTWDLVAKTDGF